jgi:hypothetical protein
VISPGNIFGANHFIKQPTSSAARGLRSRAACVQACISLGCENAPYVLRVGASTPFVDPRLAAMHAPLAWRAAGSAPVLGAMTARPIAGARAHLPLPEMQAARHIILGPAGDEFVVLRDSNRAVTLHCRGSRASLGPVDIRLVLDGVPDPALVTRSVTLLHGLLHHPEVTVDSALWRILRRDGLAALDGKSLGATYRDVATVLYGPSATRKEVWRSANNPLKEHMRRALAIGRYLRDGGYLELLD